MAKVLIVDDSPATIFTLKKLIEDCGHEVVTAENGEQALEVASRDDYVTKPVNPEKLMSAISDAIAA